MTGHKNKDGNGKALCLKSAISKVLHECTTNECDQGILKLRTLILCFQCTVVCWYLLYYMFDLFTAVLIHIILFRLVFWILILRKACQIPLVVLYWVCYCTRENMICPRVISLLVSFQYPFWLKCEWRSSLVLFVSKFAPLYCELSSIFSFTLKKLWLLADSSFMSSLSLFFTSSLWENVWVFVYRFCDVIMWMMSIAW